MLLLLILFPFLGFVCGILCSFVLGRNIEHLTIININIYIKKWLFLGLVFKNFLFTKTLIKSIKYFLILFINVLSILIFPKMAFCDDSSISTVVKIANSTNNLPIILAVSIGATVWYFLPVFFNWIQSDWYAMYSRYFFGKHIEDSNLPIKVSMSNIEMEGTYANLLFKNQIRNEGSYEIFFINHKAICTRAQQMAEKMQSRRALNMYIDDCKMGKFSKFENIDHCMEVYYNSEMSVNRQIIDKKYPEAVLEAYNCLYNNVVEIIVEKGHITGNDPISKFLIKNPGVFRPFNLPGQVEKSTLVSNFDWITTMNQYLSGVWEFLTGFF